MAPEMIMRRSYGKSVDVWAAGVISFILLEGNYPFNDSDQHKLFLKISKGDFQFRPKYWDAISLEARDFVSNLLQVNVKERFTVAQALEHPWMRRQETDLSRNHLPQSLSNLIEFNARRKFKGAVNLVRGAVKMQKMLSGDKVGSPDEQEIRLPDATNPK